jgi:hypothetical protein
MSMFIITRTTEYVAILADNLAHIEYALGNKAPLPAPKLTHVAPCIFATHAGSWQPAYEILSNFHEYILSSPRARTFDEIEKYLEREGNLCQKKYCKLWNKESFDLRVPIILTGPYRHPEDIKLKISSTILIFETANKFKPTRSSGGWFAIDNAVTSVLTELMALPVIKDLMYKTPLSMVQILRAIHSFVSHISVYVSTDCSVAIIGEEDEFTLFEGNMVTLPMQALKYG